jgi:hypothetical protein
MDIAGLIFVAGGVCNGKISVGGIYGAAIRLVRSDVQNFDRFFAVVRVLVDFLSTGIGNVNVTGSVGTLTLRVGKIGEDADHRPLPVTVDGDRAVGIADVEQVALAVSLRHLGRRGADWSGRRGGLEATAAAGKN